MSDEPQDLDSIDVQNEEEFRESVLDTPSDDLIANSQQNERDQDFEKESQADNHQLKHSFKAALREKVSIFVWTLLVLVWFMALAMIAMVILYVVQIASEPEKLEHALVTSLVAIGTFLFGRFSQAVFGQSQNK